MIYYFVSLDGDFSSEENAKGWFEIDNDTYFSVKRKAISTARKRIKVRIAELKEYSKNLGKEDK